MTDVAPEAPGTPEADDTPTDRDTAAAEFFAELDEIAVQLAGVPKLYERRVTLYKKLRELDPPVAYTDIAGHTDAGPEAVRVAVNKRNRAEAGDPISRTTKRKKTGPGRGRK